MIRRTSFVWYFFGEQNLLQPQVPNLRPRLLGYRHGHELGMVDHGVIRGLTDFLRLLLDLSWRVKWWWWERRKVTSVVSVSCHDVVAFLEPSTCRELAVKLNRQGPWSSSSQVASEEHIFVRLVFPQLSLVTCRPAVPKFPTIQESLYSIPTAHGRFTRTLVSALHPLDWKVDHRTYRF